MKPKSTLRSFLLTSGVFIAGPLAQAQSTYYWDDNAAGTNFGTAGVSAGTWAAPTAGTVAGWSLSSTGANAFAAFTTATNDSLNFGNGATGLAAGTITVAGTVNAGNITYASGSGAIVLSGAGSTIGFGAAPIITTNAAVGTVNTIASTLSGAATSFTKAGVGTLALTYTTNTFNPGSIVISGGILRIGNNTATTLNSGNYAGNITNNGTLQIWNTSNQTFSTGVISGSGSLVKAYGGTLFLSGLNTYTGKTSIDPQTTAGGSISVSSFDYITTGTYANHLLGSSLGAPTTAANGTIAIGSTGKQASCNLIYTGTGETTDRVLQFNLNGTATQTLTANNASGLLKFTSPILISGGVSGNVILAGSGAGEISSNLPNISSTTGKLQINSTSTGSWTLSGNNIALTKGVTLTAGKLNINHANALGATAGTFTIGAATFDSTSGPIVNANNNPIAWNGDSTFTGTNTLDLGTGAVTLGANRSIVVSASTLTVGGVVGGAFNIVLGGNGTLALTNAGSTYTGKTTIGNNVGSSLRLRVSKLDNLSAISSLGAPTTIANGLIQIGHQSNSSTLELTGGTSASSTNRQVSVGSNSNGSGSATIQNNNTNAAHTLTFSNAAFNVANASVSGFNRALTLAGSNAGDNTIAGAIINTNNTSNNIRVVKDGAGKWILAGTNTYTGSTTVSNGTLLINGNSSTANGAVNVNAGTLGGIGRSGGAVTVGATATLSPGASIESLDVASLSMASTSVFAYEVADNTATGADLLASRTTLSLTGVTLSLDVTSLAALASGSWNPNDKLTLISYLGADITSGFTGYLDDTSYFFGLNEWKFDYNDTVAGGNYGTDAIAGGQNRFVTMTVVPEPRAALLGGLGLLMLRRRRRN